MIETKERGPTLHCNLEQMKSLLDGEFYSDARAARMLVVGLLVNSGVFADKTPESLVSYAEVLVEFITPEPRQYGPAQP